MINNFEICNARELFINKGILNRKILSDQVIYSWVRSKLHNISFEILDEKINMMPIDLLSINKRTSEMISYFRKINLNNSKIFIINNYGNVLYKSNNDLFNLPLIDNFCEESIGTTAAGISLVTGENSHVFGCEHYNGSLTSFISESIVIKSEKLSDQIYICLFSKISETKEHEILFNQVFLELGEKNSIEIENDAISVGEIESKPVKTEEETVEIVKKEVITIDEEFRINKVCKVFTLSVVEKNTILDALDYFSWNMKKSAEALGIGRSTLYRKIKEYSIRR